MTLWTHYARRQRQRGSARIQLGAVVVLLSAFLTAQSVSAQESVPAPEQEQEQEQEQEAQQEHEQEKEEEPEAASTTPAASERAPDNEEGLVLLSMTIPRGTIARIPLRSSESFAGARVETPIVVVNGKYRGPTLCIVAGVHGDEVNGVEVVRRTIGSVSPDSLRGTLIAVPIANISAFRRGSRYLPDRRDLNRHFPGRLFGSSASRIAYALFDQVIRHCEAVVDIHTGSFHRSNLHQLRADLSDPGTLELADDFGAEVIVNSRGRIGTLRRATTDTGIPAITVEAGEPTRFDEKQVIEALGGILRLLFARGMIEKPIARPQASPALAYLETRWVRTDQGGILVSRVSLGDTIEAGQILGTISDPLSDEVEAIVSPMPGRLIGMALDQVVMPGFAAYHLGFGETALEDTKMVVPPVSSPPEPYDPEGIDLDERPE